MVNANLNQISIDLSQYLAAITFDIEFFNEIFPIFFFRASFLLDWSIQVLWGKKYTSIWYFSLPTVLPHRAILEHCMYKSVQK